MIHVDVVLLVAYLELCTACSLFKLMKDCRCRLELVRDITVSNKSVKYWASAKDQCSTLEAQVLSIELA